MRRVVGAALLAAHALVVVPPAAAAELSSLLAALDLGGYSPGERPPAFAGRTPYGGGLTLGELRGKVVVLTFWATWCVPCRTELPLLETLHREIGPGELAVVAVNARERATAVREYAQELGLTFALVLDPRGEIQRLYGVVGVPTTFLIARDGRAVARAIGPRDWTTAQFRELVQTLVREPAMPPAGGPKR